MGHEELAEDLRRKSSELIQKIKHDAESRVEDLRNRKRREFERRQSEVMGQLDAEAEKVASPILHEAEREALSIEEEAMGRLAERLHGKAFEMLHALRQRDYESVFAAFVKELPRVAWEKVQVNPQDTELARHFFPGCEISTDQAIIGGFIASADGGKFQVVNTLQKRLEIGWRKILSLVLEEILKEQNAAPSV